MADQPSKQEEDPVRPPSTFINHSEHSMRKLFVIGLDGATFDLIKPFIAQGKLPTFKKLMDSGVWSELRSTVPPVTASAWARTACSIANL